MPRKHISSNERRLARLIDQDRSRVERVGMQAALIVGAHTQQAVMRAYKTHGDIVSAMRTGLAAAVPLLTSAMVAGYLSGRRRSDIFAKPNLSLRQTAAPRRSSVYDATIDTLQARVDLPPDELQRLEAACEADALRVVKQASDATEKQLEQAMLDMTREGVHVREGRQILREAFANAGMTPGNSFTLEAIFRTQTQTAYGAGRWQASQDPDIQEILWGYKYVTVGDDRVRPEHEAMDGVTLPKEDPFWLTNWPPNGWCCRCAVIDIFNKPTVRAPDSMDIDGKIVIPGADPGFRFNPGIVLAI